MATADTSIYGQVGRTSRIQSPLEQQNALSQVLQGVNQNRMAEMQMRQAQANEAKQNRLSALLTGDYETPEAREDATLRGGFYKEAQDMRKSRLEGVQTQAATQKSLADAEKVKIATAIEKISAVGQLLGGVRDQGTYDQARAQAQAMGLDVSNMPPQYDPALVEQKRAQSLSMQQQLEQMWKQKDFGLNVRKQDETERNNQVQNRISQGQLGVAQGNLGVAQANLGLRRQELESGGKPPPGYRVSKDGNLEPIPGGPADLKTNKEGNQRVTDAKDVLGMLNDAEKLLPLSTGSYAGVAMDEAARAFGGSTKGAQAAAELKALQGALVSKMPKMSGPQSDKDVLLYREMAGQIGDPTIPAATKQAAIQTIRRLNERYAGLPDSSASGPKLGDVVDGYRFKGGNPADPKSWEKK